MSAISELGRATSAEESPAYFPGADAPLFGILTRPTTEPRGTAAVIMVGGGSVATNRNRFSVRLARGLATDGYHTLRFDYHGVGESAGIVAHRPRLDEPYVADAEAAVRWLNDAGIAEYVLIGSCFGARTALAFAPSLSALRALVLLAPPLRDLQAGDGPGTRLAQRVSVWEAVLRALRPRAIRGWLDPARRRTYRQFLRMKARAAMRRLLKLVGVDPGPDDYWVSNNLLGPIRTLAGRGVPVLLVYGTKDQHYDDFLTARQGRLGPVLERAPLTRVEVVEGHVHGFTQVDAQRRVSELVFDWLEQVDPAPRAPTVHGTAEGPGQ